MNTRAEAVIARLKEQGLTLATAESRSAFGCSVGTSSSGCGSGSTSCGVTWTTEGSGVSGSTAGGSGSGAEIAGRSTGFTSSFHAANTLPESRSITAVMISAVRTPRGREVLFACAARRRFPNSFIQGSFRVLRSQSRAARESVQAGWPFWASCSSVILMPSRTPSSRSRQTVSRRRSTPGKSRFGSM